MSRTGGKNRGQQTRSALFIDGANFYATCRDLDLEVDFIRLRDYFATRSNLIRAYYYTVLPEGVETPLKRMIDFLDYNNYTVVTKPAKSFYDQSLGETRTKGSTDMELAIDMLTLSPYLDKVYLFSGDRDFCRLVREVQRQGIQVVAVSSLDTNILSDEMRREPDEFLDLLDIKKHILRGF